MANNLFKKTQTKTTAPAKGKKGKEKREVDIADLETFANISAVMNALEALKGTYESKVKDQMAAEFVRDGMAVKRRPENFRGVEGDASASCELRKRTSRSRLSDDEVEKLEKTKVHYDVNSIVEEAFQINQKYLGDEELLAKVSETLAGVVPDDFIVYQEETTTRTVSNKSLDDIFVVEDETTVAMLLDIVGTLAIKSKLEEGDITDAMKKLEKLIG